MESRSMKVGQQVVRCCVTFLFSSVEVGSFRWVVDPEAVFLDGSWKDGAGELAGTLTMGLSTVLVVHSVGRT